MKSSNVNRNDGAGDAPAWLLASVRQYQRTITTSESHVPAVDISAELQARCREAAQRGCEIARLRAERQQVGRLLVPLADYFETLAGRVHLALQPLYGVLGIGNNERPDRQSADGLARLARLIGLELEDALLLLRLGFARVSTQGRGRNGRGRRALLTCASASPAKCATTLRELEGQYQPALQTELQQATAAFRTVYAEDEV
jgi:hypothetical protein